MTARLIFAALGLLALTASQAAGGPLFDAVHRPLRERGAADQPAPDRDADRWEPVSLTPEVRSLLLPGWGQLSRGESGRGAAFVTGFGLAALAALGFGLQASAAYDAYRAATTPEEAVRERRRTRRFDRFQNLSIGLAATVWLGSVVDLRLRREAAAP